MPAAPASIRIALGLQPEVYLGEVPKAAAYTQTFSTTVRTVPNPTASNPPAGGTGTAAGAYDTAGNRDLMITSLTNVIADVAELRKLINAIIDDLQALQLVG